jgi:hypothetical protein
VIPFGPESYCQGSGNFVLRVGRRNGRLHCWGCTPLEKSASSSKDTSIHGLAPKENIREQALPGPVKVNFVTVVVTLRRR